MSAGAGARLLALTRLGVDLRQELRDLALLHQRVDVQHRLVAGREDGLVLQQVQDLGARAGALVQALVSSTSRPTVPKKEESAKRASVVNALHCMTGSCVCTVACQHPNGGSIRPKSPDKCLGAQAQRSKAPSKCNQMLWCAHAQGSLAPAAARRSR